MDRYTPNTDYTYQVSTIQALTTLQSFYDLALTDRWKDLLVDCLAESHRRNPLEGGSFVTESPSLIFHLNGLATEKNIGKVRDLVEGLSHVYVSVIGERLDVASVSYLMFAWCETQTYNKDICDKLIEICMQKEKANLFYEDGCSTDLVNIVKSVQEL